MSTAATAVVLVVVVAAVAALVAVLRMPRGARIPGAGGGARLKRRFGPEYERALRQHDGDAKATRQELTARVERFGGLQPRSVDAQARERYGARWTGLQARFVDEPAQALGEADRLIAGLAAERGFPDARSPDHFDALSVHHPHQVHGYRKAHRLAERGDGAGAGAGGGRATEELRQALIASRGLFDELLRGAGKRAQAPEPAPVHAPKSPPGPGTAAKGAPERSRPFAARLGALAGVRRPPPPDRPTTRRAQ